MKGSGTLVAGRFRVEAQPGSLRFGMGHRGVTEAFFALAKALSDNGAGVVVVQAPACRSRLRDVLSPRSGRKYGKKIEIRKRSEEENKNEIREHSRIRDGEKWRLREIQGSPWVCARLAQSNPQAWVWEIGLSLHLNVFSRTKTEFARGRCSQGELLSP